jgi:acetylornithine deacetylase
MDIQLDHQFLIHTLQQLIRINSVNPSLDPHAPGEAKIGSFLAQTLKNMNLKPKIHHLEPGRVNVTTVIKGTGGGRSLMINGHMDTVGIYNMKEPFSGTISEGKIFGRGSIDMKAGIAAALTLVKALVEHKIKLKGDLIIAFVADEEYASIGTEHLVKVYQTDAAIVTEPTGLDICLAHKGFGLFEFSTTGKAAHGSLPEEGIDANMHMGMIMTELNRLSHKLQSTSSHPLLGRPSLHVPVIKGGTEPFTYAENCKMKMEIRTLPRDTLEKTLSELNAIIKKLSARIDNFNAAVKPIMWRDPYEIDKTNKIVTKLFDSVKGVTGRKPSYIGHPWWEDSSLLGKAGMDTVIIGPKGGGLHAKKEWVDIRSVIDLAGILYKTTLNYCNLLP